MNDISKDIVKQLKEKHIGTINLKHYKHLYAYIPDLIRKNSAFDEEQTPNYVCSKIMSIRKYSEDNINITYIDLDNKYREHTITETDTKYNWNNLTTTIDIISELEFSENFKDFLNR